MSPINQITEFIDLLVNTLGTKYESIDDQRSTLAVCLVDLSPLRLRLSRKTPCIIVTKENIQQFGEEVIVDMVRQELQTYQDVPGSALVFVEGHGSFLKDVGADPYWASILDAQILLGIQKTDNFKRAFTDALCRQIPLRFLSPYEANQPVLGNQFYGRDKEKSLILTHSKRSFAIEGGRRIGKTSLLMEIKNILLNKQLGPNHEKRVVQISFWGYKSVEFFFEEIVRHFGVGYPKLVRDDFSSYFPRFINRMRGAHGGPIIFILDEVDDLIEYERRTGIELLDLFRRVVEAGDGRLLLAGFRDLSDELNRHDTALNFCDRIRLSNLDREAAISMLREPMANMGVKLERDVFPQILSDTGGHPQLIQVYCQGLVEMLDEVGARTITMSHVKQAKLLGRLHDALTETLIDNTTDLEFAVVCGLVGRDEFGLEDIERILNSREICLELKAIHRMCRVLTSVGIIIPNGPDVYHFSVPLQATLAHRLASDEFIWRKAHQYAKAQGIVT